MKNHDRKTLESSRPDVGMHDAVVFCLERLFEDETRTISSEVCNGLIYEELIGALLLARDKGEQP